MVLSALQELKKGLNRRSHVECADKEIAASRKQIATRHEGCSASSIDAWLSITKRFGFHKIYGEGLFSTAKHKKYLVIIAEIGKLLGRPNTVVSAWKYGSTQN